MNKDVIQLGDFYGVKKLNAIINAALDGEWEIHFLSRLTNESQALTRVQLHGLTKFSQITILLETGQTYQQGLGVEDNGVGTYQDIGLMDLIVDEETFKRIAAVYPAVV
jgi:hypothetical protein